jgi:hypothetical protein
MKLRNKRGELTSYAFACGYIEKRKLMTLSREHNTYLIKGISSYGVHVMRGFTTLGEARKALYILSNLYT